MKFEQEIKFNGKLSIIRKLLYLLKNYLYWKSKNFLSKRKLYRDINFIRESYNKSRKNVDPKDLSIEEFIFGQNYLTKKKNILFQNEIYLDLYYKPTLFRYLRLNDFIKKELNNSDTVIDIGCGWGSATLFLAKLNPDINFIGIDLSKDSINLAKIGKKKYGIDNLEFYEHNLLNEVKLKSKFNLAYSINVLEQLDNHLEEVLNNILNLNTKNIILYEPDQYLMKNNLVGKISRLRSLKLNKLQNLFPTIKKVLLVHSEYKLESAQNLDIAVNPFNSSSEIILKNLKF
tara:strand:- start:2144 stop:3007 length:864 start_codon:yes stop_codon:yes gene_type:complete